MTVSSLVVSDARVWTIVLQVCVDMDSRVCKAVLPE